MIPEELLKKLTVVDNENFGGQPGRYLWRALENPVRLTLEDEWVHWSCCFWMIQKLNAAYYGPNKNIHYYHLWDSSRGKNMTPEHIATAYIAMKEAQETPNA